MSDTYVYEAFGDLTDHIGSTENYYLFTGEQYDPNAGFYYLRARYYNPGNGRFITQDSYKGKIYEPVSLHKYLYAYANPIIYFDPSGLITISEQTQSIRMLDSLLKISRSFEHVLQIYDKAMAVKDIVVGLRSVLTIIGGNGSLLPSAVSTTSWPPDPKTDFSEAANRVVNVIGRVMGSGKFNWTSGYIKTYRSGHKLKAFYIYAPVFTAGNIRYTFNTGMKIGGIPVKVRFGSPYRGGLIGFGVLMKNERQLFRMDWHKAEPDHGKKLGGIKANELDYWVDTKFHYHVLRW